VNNLVRFYILIFILAATLFSCTRNPLGEQIYQSIANANFIISHTCTTLSVQDSAYTCTSIASDTSSPVTWTLAATTTCAWASIDATTGAITGTPLDAHVGTCNLVVGASQAIKSALPITITVTTMNIAPILTIGNAASIAEDAAATVIRDDSSVQASEEGDGVYYFDHATTTAPRCSDNVLALTVDTTTGAVTFAPAADYTGTCNIKVGFNDQTGSANAAATSEFSITVNPVNDQPVLGAIANQSISENTAAVVNFSFNDVDSAVTCSAASLSFASNNSGLIDPSNITLGGAIPNCTATINPTANQTGVATLTLTGADGALSAVQSFTVTVNAVNDPPTISTIAPQTTSEDTAINVAFVISDPDSVITCTSANLSVTSSDLNLMPLASVVFSGTFPNCVATFTPNTDENGVTNIQITVIDNGLPSLQASSAFSLTVNAVNDPPTISAIANQSTNEDTALALAFTMNDVDNAINCNAATASTSDASVIPVASIVFTGTMPNCTATLTPVANTAGIANLVFTVSDGSLNATEPFSLTVDAVNDAPTISAIADQTIAEDVATAALAFTIDDLDSGITCAGSVTAVSSNQLLISNANIIIAGATPNCTVTVTPEIDAAGGPVNITLTLTDSGNPLPALTATEVFAVTITPVNDVPTISAIANTTTNENTPTAAIAFTIDDVESAVTCASSVVASSSDASRVASAGIVIAGTAPNCTVTLTPVTNASGGPVDITLSLTDSGFPLPALTATTTFQLTITSVNNAPDISAIANQSVNEDASVIVNFTIGDVDSVVNCSGASLSATSSDMVLLPVASIVFGGAFPNCTATITPDPNQNGTSNLSITVTDGTLTDVSNFSLTVSPVNDAPTISNVADQTINEDSATAALAFTIDDTDSTVSCATSVTASSSNTTVIPAANVVIAGTAPNCTVTVTPDANQSGGPIQISLILTDAGTPAPNLTALETFTVTVTGLNDAPTISTVADQTTNEDTPTAALAFTIDDVDSMVACATSVTVSSSNTTLVPSANIVVAGTAPNCTVTVTPAADENGGPVQVTLTLTDAGSPAPNLTAQSIFNVTVTAVNDAPTILAIGPQNTNEDTTLPVTFTISDIDSVLDCTTSMTASSSNTTLVPLANIAFSGALPNCTVTIAPAADENGTADLTLTVSDGSLTDADTFTLTVNAVNDAPIISAIGPQSVNEDNNLVVNFTVDDLDSVLTCTTVNISASSTVVGLVPTANIVLSGAIPNCTATITPVANANGNTDITLTINDNAAPNLQDSETFTMTVNAVNDAPVIVPIGAQSTNEDTALPLAFSISDVDDTLDCTTSVTASSANGSLVAVSGVVFTGTATNCVATITPAPNQNGTVDLTFTVDDTALTDAETFTLTVNAIDDVPVISAVAAQSTNEDTVVAVNFTIADVETVLDCTTSMTVSSSNTTLVPTASVVFSGALPNCTATITPSADQIGTANLTLIVNDGAQTATSSFILTVNAVNDAPVISVIAAQGTNEDTAHAVNFTITDIDSVLDCSTSVSASSSNTTVVPVANVVFTGAGLSCTGTVTPAPGESGASDLTFIVTDGALTDAQLFTFTVNPVNDAPTISTVADQTINEDAATAPLAFTINDVDDTLDCSTSMTVSSSNTTVIPIANVALAGAMPNCTVTVTPAANQNGGPVQITLTVADGSSGFAQSTFNVTVDPVNDVPVISAIVDQTVNEDTATAALAFTIDDIDSTIACNTAVTASSSNTTLVPNANIVFGGAAPNCTVTVTPAVNQNGGPVQISLTLTDAGTPAPNLTAQSTFNLTVTGTNDAPTISAIADQTINEDSATTALAFTIDDADHTMDCSTSLSASSSNTTVIPNANIVFGGTAPNCTVTVTPAANQNGGPVNISVTVADTAVPVLSAQEQFTVTVNAVNDAPTISNIVNQTVNEDTATTALAFTVDDIDSTVNCSSSMTASSSDTTKIPNANIVFAGAAPNCTVTVTPAAGENGGPTQISLKITDAGTPAPNLTAQSIFTVTIDAINDAPTISAVADQTINEDVATAAIPFTISDSDSTLTCSTSVSVASSNTTIIPTANVVVGGTLPNCTVTVTPAANQNGGPVQISLTVTDAGTPAPNLTAQTTFNVTVNAVNDVPTISGIAHRTISENTDTGALAFTINDVDSTVDCSSSLTASSSNTTIIPSGNIVFGGAAPNCTVTVTPAANENGGPVQITLVLTDAGSPAPNLTALTTFNVTVIPVSTAPSISAIANQTVNEDISTGPLAFMITDLDDTLNCTTSVTASSSNTTLIPNGNIVFGGALPNCTVTITPAANQNGGPVQISLTVTDGASTAQTTFEVTVDQVNDVPTISTIANQTVNEDGATSALALTINDVDSTLDCSTSITASSSNTTLIPNANIVFGGALPNCTVTVTPAAGQNGGPVQLTLTVTDAGSPLPALTAVSVFNVTVSPVNDAPTITPIAGTAVNEDNAALVTFDIDDTDSVLLCTSANLAVSSTNVGLVPTANVVFGGTYPNCTATATPVANMNGTTNITVTVLDNGTPNLQAAQTFTLTVNAVNDAPVISAVADQTVNEDVATTALAFTISDVDSTLSCATSLTVSSSNTTLIPNANIVFGGALPNCTVTVTPAPGENGGPVQISLTLTDAGTPAPNLTVQSTFNVTVNAINDAPVISAIADQTVAEDTATAALAFTIADTDSTLSCNTSVTASSSNTTIIPTANIVIGGTAPNCTVTVTPAAGENGGPVQISLTLTDAGTPLPALTVQSVFNVTVSAVNDAPTISVVADQTINEDTATAALAFTIADTDSTLSCNTSVTASSSNTTIIPTANIVIGGTLPNCTVTVTPALHENGGPVQITLTVTDSGTPAPNLTAQSTFNVTVNAVNDVPTISTIANQTINEDNATTALALTINDVDSTVSCATSLTASSSNTTVIPNTNIVFGGTAPNCTVTVTPAAGENGGPIQISLTLTDAGAPAPNLTAQSTFNLTVTAVNDAPVISAIADQTINEDVNTAALAFTLSDVDSTLDCSTSMTASSSNTTIIPNANVVFGGAFPNCTVTVTPAANQNGGPVQISVTVADGGTPNLSAQEVFTVTVDPINDAPTITPIVNQTVSEDTATAALAFNINDIDSTLNCTTSMTASSSDTTLIPTANVVFGGAYPNCTVTVTPALNENGGPVQISLTVTDAGTPAPNLTAQSTFDITVNGTNDTPTISTIAAQTINEDSATAALAFTIGDTDSTIDCATHVTASSSNTTVIPTANVVIAGSFPNCTVTVTPAANQNGGPVQISLTLTDAGTPAPNLTAQSTFNVTVTPVNDAPVIGVIADQTINEDANTGALTFTIDDIDSTVACNTEVTVSSSNTTVIPNANVVVAGTAPNCTVTVTPAANQNGGPVQISLTLTDAGTPAPNLTAQSTFNVTVNAVNDVPVLSAIANQTINEDANTGALAFTISDVDSTLDCSSSMTASSSNTTLVPNANIVFAGTLPNCTVTVTPDASMFGTADITVTVTDAGTPAPNLTASRIFTLTVNPVNDAPTITPIADENINEDANVVVNFDIADTDDVMVCTSANLTASSSNTTLVPNASIVFGGVYPNCTATITPAANINGAANITITVIDHGTPSLQAARSFALTVNAVNDAPTISTVADQTINEDANTGALAFTINDIDSTMACNTAVTVASSNTTVIPNGNVVIGGTAPNCTVTVTPAADENGGPIQISLTLTDAGTPAPNLTAQSTFNVIVNAINDAPLISTIANQTIAEDSATAALAFTISDVDSTVDCSSSMIASSSNTTIIPNANVVFGGTAPNCTVTVTPDVNQNGGPVNITLTVTDAGTPAPNIAVNSQFTVTVSAVNDTPTISAIADLATNEDTATAALAFTINDSDSTLSCATSVTVSSSNTTIVPNANIVIGGAVPNCTVTVTPAAHQNGGPVNISLTLTDAGTGSPGVLTAQSTFALTVNAVNDVPTISTIANQTTAEDTATVALALTINDVDSTLNCASSLTASSSNTTIIPNVNIVFGGTAPNCTVTVTPAAHQNGGPVQISLTVTDAGTPAPNLTAQSTFEITVNAVNDAPTISAIVNQIINEEGNTGAIAFTIDDVDSTIDCSSSMTATSSNTTIIPNANIVFGGAAPNCTVTVTAAPNQSGGPVNISLKLTDAGTPAPSLTAQSQFTVTVNGVNDAPTISTVADQTINEDAATAALAFTIDDVDSTVSCATSMTVSSSNTTIIPTANIVVGGAAPNCTVTVTPAANQSGGPVQVTLTVTDAGTPAPNLTAQSTFNVTVNGVNDAPSISAIANQTINEDAATAAIAFTIDDIDSAVSCATSMTVSSSNTTIIPNANIVIGGTAPNCTVTVTPDANQNGGPVNITLTLTDAGTPAPNLSVSSQFTVTVNAVNDAPTISTVADLSTNEDTATAALAFTINDADSTLNCNTSMTVSSSNTTIIPIANIVVGGAVPNCTVTVTPAANQNGGPVNITLTVTDSGTGSPGVLTAQSTFALTVDAVNDAPVISAIAAQSIAEDGTTGALAFTITDTDSTLNCNSSMTASSSNTTMIPTANVVFGGTFPNCTVTVTPAANEVGGPAQITVMVTDSGSPLPALTANSAFNVTVSDVNDAPTISAIANQSVNEDAATAALAFTIDDLDSTVTCAGSVTVSSSNTTIVPNANIVVGGVAPNCTVTVTPAANENGGPVNITLTLTDAGTPAPNLSVSSPFTLTVNAVNDAPVLSAIAAQSENEDNNEVINFTISDIDSTLDCTTSLTASSSNTALILNTNIVFSGAIPNCTATITPLADQNGTADLTFTVTDSGTPLPALTASRLFTQTIVAINDAPTMAAIGNETINEDGGASVAFVIADTDSTLLCTSANVSAASTNTTLVPVANIVFGGTFPNCTAAVTPAVNESGSADITLTVFDNGTPNLQAPRTFTFAVNAVNDVPTISSIANQTVNENTATAALALTINDIDSTLSCATNVTASSSNTTLIPTGNIVIGGAAPNCTVTVTPGAYQYGGPTQITLTLTDAGTPGVLTAQSTFNVTVDPVNQAPTISAIANQTINEDSNTGAISFTIDDIDSTISCAANVTASSSNTTVIPNGNVVVAGTAPNCTVTVTPALNENGGPVQISLTVTDAGTPAPNLTAQSTFNVTVGEVNDAPTMSVIGAQTMNESASLDVNFTISDLDATLACSAANLTASSSNTTILPTANITFSGTAPNCVATLAPAANQNGAAFNVTIIVNDNGNTGSGGSLTAQRSFSLTVNAINDAPTISAITNGTTDSDTAIQFTFAIDDLDAALACSSANLTASSSNTTMIPVANVVFSGTAPNCTATVTPASNQNGQTQLTITVTDNGNTGIGGPLTNASAFTVTVRPKAPTNVTLGSSWTQTTTTPLISWTASTSNNKTDYEVGITTSSSGGNATAGWTSIGGTSISYNHASVAFAECGTYYASVRTKDSVGTYSPTFATSVASFRYDSTDPLPPSGLTIIGNAKTDRALNLSWTAGSDNCSLAGYQTSIGTSAGGQEIAAWSNTGDVTSYQRTGLTLSAATNYYINVRTIDSSGRTSSVVTMGPWNICATADAAISGAYTIPAGCYYARAKVWGGGGGRGSSGSRNAGGSGYAGADFSVTPGESLTAIVGGVGASASGQGNAAGGANGGGGGKGGGAGGGRSEISRAGTFILVAGGGGGGGDASVGGAGCDGTAGGGASGSTGDTATTNSTAGGGGGVVGGVLTIGAGARGGTCSSTYAGGPAGQFGSFNGLIGATSLGGSGVNPGNAADANRAGAGRGEDATVGTSGLIWLIWP